MHQDVLYNFKSKLQLELELELNLWFYFEVFQHMSVLYTDIKVHLHLRPSPPVCCVL